MDWESLGLGGVAAFDSAKYYECYQPGYVQNPHIDEEGEDRRKSWSVGTTSSSNPGWELIKNYEGKYFVGNSMRSSDWRFPELKIAVEPASEDAKKYAQIVVKFLINEHVPNLQKLGYVDESGHTRFDWFPIDRGIIGHLLRLECEGKLTRSETRKFIDEWLGSDTAEVGPIMKKCMYYALGVEPPKQDTSELETAVKEIMSTVPFKGKEENRVNFYFGQVMKKFGKDKFNSAEIRKAIENG